MADMMKFPETFDEFAEQYKIVDHKEVYTNGTELIPIFRVKQWIDNQPTADVEEVKYGYWKREENDVSFWYVCSECREEIPKTRYANDLFSSYCPYCGAKMDGGKAE